METPRRFAVAGATGKVGRHTVDVLEGRGHDVVPISRSTGVDVITGDDHWRQGRGVGKTNANTERAPQGRIGGRIRATQSCWRNRLHAGSGA